jgi:HSP20 family protein
MSTVAKRGRTEIGDRLGHLDRVFEEWMRSLPMRRPLGLAWDWPGDDLIRVDEFRDGNVQVIKADLPGVDPDNDVQLTIVDGVLRISAERRIGTTQDGRYRRHELRYGTFTRTLPLPEGVEESAICASYRDGILEIRVPLPEPKEATGPRKIAINQA